ncbi:MAG TPA: prephenate dehydratase [Defluviitoga sp.]|nr:prephenate dehydratase [Defluviitoga sp.]HOP24021.1 prephenate dehydratase [Defluviitoga sp.]HPZ29004.1 prephenate dehydratase [Defluviitoga sp.]HQD62342.1 prephenate dehydratase [Defluviitoga sp.]
MKNDEAIKCSYLGPIGTYSEIAAKKYFGENNIFIPQKTIADVFESVKINETDYGVVPIENSVEGSVSITMDLLFEISEIKVVAECIVPIRHFLLSYEKIELNNIKTIYSHQQAVGQCSKFIRNYLNNPEIIFTASTASACQLIKNIPNSAAIASENVAKIYSLFVLAEDIQDSMVNATRFFIISNLKDNSLTHKSRSKHSSYKTSIICCPKFNKAGVLYNILKNFKKQNINLTRIESRPTKKQLGEYSFYIDLEGSIDDKKVQKALNNIEKMSSFFKILGSYNKWEE